MSAKYELTLEFHSILLTIFNHSLKVILGVNMSQIRNSSYNKNFTQKFQAITMKQILMPANDYSFKKKIILNQQVHLRP